MDPSDPRQVELWTALAVDRESGSLRPLGHYLSEHGALGDEQVARAWLEVAAPEPTAVPEPSEDGPLHIGPYRVLSELGRGGQAVVYRAVHEGLGREVALKVLAPGALGGDTARLRFEREVGIAAKLDHPGLGTVYESGSGVGVTFLAIRLLEGGSLADGLARDRAAGRTGRALLPPHGGGVPALTVSEGEAIREVVQLVERAARTLHIAHGKGIVHRDVKPSNLMFDDEGTPVWVDFGLARDTSRAALTLTGDVLGTPAYMAPELLDADGSAIGPQVDVWSLGVLLFEALSLERPFEAASPEALLLSVRRDAPRGLRDANPAAPADLALVCATALERDPARRYASAEALAEDLACVLEHRPIAARPTPLRVRLRNWTLRNPALAAGLAIAFAATALISLVVGGFRAETKNLGTQKDAALAGQKRLTDRELARSLVAEARTGLWPIDPSLVDRCSTWLLEADGLTARLPEHRGTLAELTAADAKPDSAEQRLARWMVELIADAQAVEDARDAVLGRLERASSHERRTALHEDWPTARAAIAASLHYGGLDLAPQMGLVPLGPNPAGLWEFWHAESGARPPRSAERGAWVEEGSGVVLVLVPGGRFTMGCHPTQGANRDPEAQANEVPFHELELAPFFVSKFELTQDQFVRSMDGDNPSQYPIGYRFGDVQVGWPTSPVERVSRPRAREACARLGLVLPTEAQWEYAARADSHTPWSFGGDVARAAEFANFYGDEARSVAEGHPFREADLGHADPFERHAPVGSFAPNPFGLHDVHGNVFEWCRDGYVSYEVPARERDGLRADPDGDLPGVIRGGCWWWPAAFGRSARRVSQLPDETSFDLGFRPVRALRDG